MPEIFKAAGADFAVFYLRHFKAIYRVCYAFLKNAEDAEDCTEDVFVRQSVTGKRAARTRVADHDGDEPVQRPPEALVAAKGRTAGRDDGGHARRVRQRARGAGRSDGAAGQV